MKKIIALIFTLFILVSCVTPSHSFLAKKHNVGDKNVNVLQETKLVSSYSPYFELVELMEFTKKGITIENYDSIACVYNDLINNIEKKANCIAYDVTYSLDNDTLQQRVYFIDMPTIKITHDKEIIDKMLFKVKINLMRFKAQNNGITTIQNVDGTIFI